jgi:hypothetical protein
VIAETESNHGKARIFPKRPIVLYALCELEAEFIRSAPIGTGLAYCLQKSLTYRVHYRVLALSFVKICMGTSLAINARQDLATSSAFPRQIQHSPIRYLLIREYHATSSTLKPGYYDLLSCPDACRRVPLLALGASVGIVSLPRRICTEARLLRLVIVSGCFLPSALTRSSSVCWGTVSASMYLR